MQRAPSSAHVSFCVMQLLAGAVAAGCGSPEAEVRSPVGANASSASADAAQPGPVEAPTSRPKVQPRRVGGNRGDVFAYLPAECPKLRGYVDLVRLGTPKVAGAMAGLRGSMTGGTSGTLDPERARKVDAVEEEGGMKEAARAIAICATGARDFTMSIAFDRAKLKGSLADLAFIVAELTLGKAPARSEDGGVTYLVAALRERSVTVAITGDTLLMSSAPVEELQKTIAAKAGAAGFAGADNNAGWIDAYTAKVSGDLNVVASDFVLRFKMPPPTKEIGDAMRADPERGLKMVDDLVTKVAEIADGRFKGLGDLVRKVKISADGEDLMGELTLPEDVVSELLTQLGKMDLGSFGKK